MAINRAAFQKLNREQKERVIKALFEEKYKGFFSEAGKDIDVPAGYTVRVATQLTCEEQHEIVKRVFVLFEEFNTFITQTDIETVTEYLKELEKTGEFDQTRDEFWLVTNQKWTFQAYENARGRIFLMDMDMLLEGVKKYYDKSRDLRNLVRHYGILK